MEIEKPDGGVRPLGIPTVLDRIIQQAITQVMEPWVDPHFSESSFGFRPNRSAHGAIRCVQSYIREGHKIAVDADLSKFFDRVDHDILMARVSRLIDDKRVLKLIGKYLRAGVVINNRLKKTSLGVPQGGLCKALHNPPYAKKKTMQSNYEKGMKLMHFYPIHFA